MKKVFWLSVSNALLSLSLTPPLLNASEWKWAEQIGGPDGSIVSTGISVDSAGNSYTVGSFTGSAEFGTTSLTSSGDNDIILVKTTASGAVAWARQAGGALSDLGEGVAVDASGNVFITGSFQGTVDFGGQSLVSFGGPDIFLAKYSSSGTLVWAQSAGGTGGNRSRAVTVDAAGNAYITGTFAGQAVFDGTSMSSIGGHDVFVAAYDPSGSLLWAVRGGGWSPWGEDAGRAIAVDDSGDVYIAGSFYDMADFGPARLFAQGVDDMFVAKLSASTRTWQWAAAGGGWGYDKATQLRVDSAGDVIVAGTFEGAAFFNNVMLLGEYEGAAGWDEDYFLAKYSSSGSLAWVQRSAGFGIYGGHGLALDESDNIYFAGTYFGSATVGDKWLSSAGYDNVYLARFVPSGEFESVIAIPGSYMVNAGSMAVQPNGTIYLTGWFQGGTVSFGDTVLTHGSSRAGFIAKFSDEVDNEPVDEGEDPADDVLVVLDVQPSGINRSSKGVVPAAILGDADLDVSLIDVSTISIWRADGVGGIVAPLSSPGIAFEDVSGPGSPDASPDGVLDLVMKFSTPELVESLELKELDKNGLVELVVSGALQDGTPFSGSDWIVVRR